MPPKRRTATDVLQIGWDAYKDFAHNLHFPFSPAKLAKMEWVADGTGHLLVHYDLQGAAQPVVFIVYGRVENNITSYRVTAEGNWPGKFNLVDHKFQFNLVRPNPGDTLPDVDVPVTYQQALSTARGIMTKQAKEPNAKLLENGIFTIGRKMFWIPVAPVVVDNDSDDEGNEGAEIPPPPAPELELYKPVDPSLDKTLQRANYPVHPASRIGIGIAGLPQNVAFDPLPAYDVETGDLILPEDYKHFQGAFVCVHFDMRHIHFGKDKRDQFSFGIKRLEYIKPAVPVSTSPNKVKRPNFRKAGTPTAADAAAGGQSQSSEASTSA